MLASKLADSSVTHKHNDGLHTRIYTLLVDELYILAI